MEKFSIHHKISKNFGLILKELNYVQKVNAQYFYMRNDAPTLKDAKLILRRIADKQAIDKQILNVSQPIVLKAPAQPVVKKIVKKEKEPNVWMYLAVISMFTTLVTMALMLLR
jgi:hypothetical protein